MFLDNWLAQRAETLPRPAGGSLADGMRPRLRRARARGRGRRASARRAAASGAARWSRSSSSRGRLRRRSCTRLMKLGAVAYPLSTRLDAGRARGRARRAGRRARPRAPSRLRRGPRPTCPLLGEHDLDAIHCRLLTSGTSGRPRSVGLTYGNFLWSAVGSAFNLGVDPADRWLCCLPLHHVAGLSIVMRSVIYGTGAVSTTGSTPTASRIARRGRGHPRLAGRDPARRACSRPRSTSPARARSSSAAGRCRWT